MSAKKRYLFFPLGLFVPPKFCTTIIRSTQCSHSRSYSRSITLVLRLREWQAPDLCTRCDQACTVVHYYRKHFRISHPSELCPCFLAIRIHRDPFLRQYLFKQGFHITQVSVSHFDQHCT